jgi:hypothetical protein
MKLLFCLCIFIALTSCKKKDCRECSYFTIYYVSSDPQGVAPSIYPCTIINDKKVLCDDKWEDAFRKQISLTTIDSGAYQLTASHKSDCP